jgi:hypothetical protein
MFCQIGERMKSTVRIAALDFLMLVSFEIVGCQSSSRSSGESGFAGGAGSFGEDPAGPGVYHGSSQALVAPAPARTASADAR